MKKITNTPAERTECLLAYFGWTGGTIHQLADATGVPVDTLLYAPKPEADPGFEHYRLGGFASTTCGPTYRKMIAAREFENAPFWIGVADSIPVPLRLKHNPGRDF